jgi:hypothetical protein
MTGISDPKEASRLLKQISTELMDSIRELPRSIERDWLEQVADKDLEITAPKGRLV